MANYRKTQEILTVPIETFYTLAMMTAFSSSRLQKGLFPAILLLLAGCAMPGAGEVAPCPAVGILPQAEKVAFLADGANQDAAQVAATARFGGYRGGCVLKNKGLQFSLDIDFSGERGKAGGALNEQRLSYFVAVLDAQEQILQRDSFTTAILFNDNGTGVAREKHQISLPLDASISDAKEAVTAAVRSQRVVMGFILTPEQLAYNTADPAAAATAQKTEEFVPTQAKPAKAGKKTKTQMKKDKPQ